VRSASRARADRRPDGIPQPIEVQLFADDPSKLIPTAKRVGSAIATIPGVTEMQDGVVPAGDALNVTIEASLEGKTAQDIAARSTTISAATSPRREERTAPSTGGIPQAVPAE
jgi:Cu/Ag efflux pump CusA